MAALVLMAMIGFAATAWTVRQAVSLTAVYHRSDIPGLRVDRVLADPDVDALFIGDSRTEIMVDPDRFDAVMRAGGHPTHSYVAAMPGMSIPEIEPLLRAILSRRPCCLKTVFIAPDFTALTPALMAAAERSIHFFTSLANTVGMLRYIDAVGPDAPDGERAGYVANSLYWTAVANLNIGLAYYLSDPRLHDIRGIERSRGHYTFPILHPVDLSNSTKEAEEYRGVVARVTTAYRDNVDFSRRISEDEWEYFTRLIERLKQQGLQVVLLHAPQGGHFDAGIAYARGYQKHCIAGVPLFDLSDPDEFPAFWDVEYRYDFDHLNTLGVPLYTAAIAGKMLDYIAHGAASACPAP